MVAWAIVVIALVLTLPALLGGDDRTRLDYSELLARVDAGEVADLSIDPDGRIRGHLVDGTAISSQLPTAVVGEGLADRLLEAGVEVSGRPPPTQWWTPVLAFGPILLLIAVFVWLARRSAAAAGGGAGAFGRSRAKVLVDEQRPSVRFEDIAGYEGVKQELGEILDFLREPQKYARVGATGPNGVLMLGPPGTGKTLFARALAGEARVPFLTVTGSAFVELFVGVGAARVRDLFEQARRMAPAIVFIDEIDAVGQRRGANPLASSDEREQTVNQLLAEMDGFDTSAGVVVLAATNRPDVLDPALLRPGRFDRHVVIPLPNRDERTAIMALHTRGKPLAPDVDVSALARATPGFSGADLANLANEAAITAVRHGREVVTAADFDEARDRIVLGRREGSNLLLPEERRAVAAHESGHALVAALSPGADPVTKVTILPSGPTLGATQQLPVDDRHLYTESYLRTSLAVLLGGRAGEMVAVGETSSGAADDLAKATELATRMVTELGMSPALGPVGWSSGPSFLGRSNLAPHPFADATQRIIDLEVARAVREAEAQAVQMLEAHRSALDKVMALLLEEETIDGERLCELLGVPGPGSDEPARESVQHEPPPAAPV